MSTTDLVEQDIEREVEPIILRAHTIIVRSAADRADAMEFLKAVKNAQKRASEFFAPIVDSAHKAWKQATASRASVLDPLEAAEKRVKLTVTTWDREEEAQRMAEQRRLQAEADEAARKERERLEREAAKLKTPEKREARLEQAAAIIAPVITVAAPEKQAGEATRKRWKMRVTDKARLIEAAAHGNELAASLLVYDEAAGNRLATTVKGAVTIPGVATYWTTDLAVRG